ncbi:MAG: hypothetical protein JWN13_7067, partial [Betaproteobacteria bacterium]|nr:hypothetical protein [Betaproteobacteria bacterium]
MTLGIRSKLFLGSLVLIGISIFAAELYMSQALEGQLTDRIRADLIVRARLIAERIASTGVRLSDE